MEIMKLIEEMETFIEQLSRKEKVICDYEAEDKVNVLISEICNKIIKVLEIKGIVFNEYKIRDEIRKIISEMNVKGEILQSQEQNVNSIFEPISKFFINADSSTAEEEIDDFMVSQNSEYPNVVVEGNNNVIKKDNEECKKVLDEITSKLDNLFKKHSNYYEIKNALGRINAEEISMNLVNITKTQSIRLKTAMEYIIEEYNFLKERGDINKQNSENDRSAFDDSSNEFNDRTNKNDLRIHTAFD